MFSKESSCNIAMYLVTAEGNECPGTYQIMSQCTVDRYHIMLHFKDKTVIQPQFCCPAYWHMQIPSILLHCIRMYFSCTSIVLVLFCCFNNVVL